MAWVFQAARNCPAAHLMRILGPIVLTQALLMVARKPKLPDGSAVGAQLVSRHLFRREALLAEQLAHEPDGCALVPSALNQDLEDLALVIDRYTSWPGINGQESLVS
jgi:hypothetical protein